MAEVRTAAGTVRGRWENAVAVFRGVPYAEPPVGARRFAVPVPIAPWDGVRDALAFGPPVPHGLTLNVWSPDLGAAGLPVMVWIHGGRYLEGSSANPHQDGAVLSAAGVVMVSLDYRVGVEGFAHIAGTPNNRGVLDQLAALRWVQRNIAAFGGDPGNVTVFGQSAGAGCIAALLVMPLAAGLFRRAIVQSMPGTYFSERLAAAVSATIAGELGVSAAVGDLTRIPPHALADAAEAVLRKMPSYVESWGAVALTPTPFSPVVDGVVLPDAPWPALASGAARHIDVLVGHTRDEYSLFDSSPFDETVNSDWLFRMPCLHLAEAHHAGGGRPWLYELRWHFNRELGASHSLDILLVFGTLSTDEVRNHPAARPNSADEVIQVSGQMRSDWAKFAATGDPGWAPYDPQARSTRVYDAEASTQPYPEESSRRIWHAHRFGTLDLND